MKIQGTDIEIPDNEPNFGFRLKTPALPWWNPPENRVAVDLFRNVLDAQLRAAKLPATILITGPLNNMECLVWMENHKKGIDVFRNVTKLTACGAFLLICSFDPAEGIWRDIATGNAVPDMVGFKDNVLKHYVEDSNHVASLIKKFKSEHPGFNS